MFEIGNDLLISRPGTGSIQIHAGHRSLRENNLYIVFYLFGTESPVYQFNALTCRTGTGQLIGIATIMAGQLIDAFMIGQADITILTFRHPPAGTAFNHRCKAPAVLEQNDLFFLLQRFPDILQKQWGELSGHPFLTVQFLYIDRDNFGQPNLFVAFFQFYKPIFTCSSIVPSFNRRGSSTQEYFRTVHRCQNNGCITRVIARSRVLLLICIFMFFIHYHQPKITERKKYGRTDSQDYIISLTA